MNRLMKLWAQHPSYVIGFATAIINLAIGFGAPLDGDQKTAIIGLLTAAATLLTHSQVSPATTKKV